MPYTPPPGASLEFDFAGPGYAPPAGDVLAFNFGDAGGAEQHIFAGAGNQGAIGVPVVRNHHAYAYAVGFSASASGEPIVWNWVQLVRPIGALAPSPSVPWVSLWEREYQVSGFDALTAGQPTAINKNRKVLAGGIVAPAWVGQPFVDHYGRILSPSGAAASLFGQQLVADAERFVGVGQGVPVAGMGQPWTSHSPRWVQPDGMPSSAVGRLIAGVSRNIEPEGWDAARFGERIIPDVQRAYPSGPREGWGNASVENRLARVSPTGFQSTTQEQYRFGRAHAWNLRQYITHQHDASDGVGVPAWPQWTAIENRNRTIAAIGTASLRPPRPGIFNNARVIAPAWAWGHDAGDAMVSYRVRAVSPEAIDPIPTSRWGVVYNDARVLLPVGIDMVLSGRPVAEATRRFFNRIGNFDSNECGVPMVADAVRTISFEQRYTPAPPDIRLPTVGLHTRYIEAIGNDISASGSPELSIRWNIVGPRWRYSPRIGDPFVRNVTPEIRAFGACAEALGVVVARTQWRLVHAMGDETLSFGIARIADRRQHVAPRPTFPPQISPLLRVWREGADIPATSWMQPAGIDSSEVAEPVVGVLSVFPEGIDADPLIFFGNTAVRYQGINDVTIGPELPPVGRPTVEPKNRRVFVGSDELWPQDGYGKPALNPYTIYAVVEAPEQAIRNHPLPPRPLHYVGYMVGTSGGYWTMGVGDPAVGHRVRYLSPQPVIADAVGDSAIINRYVRVEPGGFRATRFGRTRMGPYLQTIRPSSWHETEHNFGERFGTAWASMVRRELAPSGISAATDWGEHVVDYYHRFLRPSGADVSAMGGPGDSPRHMRQRLHVGPPDWPAMQGFAADEFGGAWVSNWIRYLVPDGFDENAIGDEFDQFHLRMRISRGAGPIVMQRAIAPAGIAPALHAGTPDARPAVHFIRPDGNAEQFRKGAF